MNALRTILLLLSLFIGATDLPAAEVKTEKTADGWRLLVDGKPYFIKGMCYDPVKIGESPHTGTMSDWMIVDEDADGRIDCPYQSWIDRNGNNLRDADEPEVGDFKLLQEMGCNTLRVYHHASTNATLQALYPKGYASYKLFNHAPNKQILRDLFEKYGIRSAMGDALGAYAVGSGAPWDPGTDYRDPEQKRNMMMSVEELVREFKNESFVLMWVLGNENNLGEYTHTNASSYPKEYAEFLNEVAGRIHELDPNHPVMMCNGGTPNIKIYAKYAPNIDIFGLNLYNDHGFGWMWNEVSVVYDRPVVLTEFGTARPKVVNGILNEDDQAAVHKACWMDIEKHAAGGKPPRNALGGFVFCWLDNWWEDGMPDRQNVNPEGSGWNHEFNGMAAQGDSKQSPLMRQMRKVYTTYQQLWTGKGEAPSPEKNK